MAIIHRTFKTHSFFFIHSFFVVSLSLSFSRNSFTIHRYTVILFPVRIPSKMKALTFVCWNASWFDANPFTATAIQTIFCWTLHVIAFFALINSYQENIVAFTSTIMDQWKEKHTHAFIIISGWSSRNGLPIVCLYKCIIDFWCRNWIIRLAWRV